VAGIGLGDSPDSVLALLGAPEQRQTSLGFVFWDYRQRGISLMWDKDSVGVRVIVLRTAAAGSVDGVRVGEGSAVARGRWGTPARVRQKGRYLDFVHSTWLVSAEVVRAKIAEITLMRVD
jgi:hypothetical protein